MAGVKWLKKALHDLDRLDQWREDDLGLPPIAPAVLVLAEEHFDQVDLNSYLPGTPVTLRAEPRDLRLLLLPVRRGQPYKIFFRALKDQGMVEVRRVRHPRQRPLKP